MILAVAAAAMPGFLGCSAYTDHHPRPQVRPRTIVAACADHNFVLTRLVWSRWDATGASGRGIARANDCTPACAGGHFHSYDVVVTVSGERTCNGRDELTGLSWRFTGRPPHGMGRSGSETFRCA